MNGKYRLIVPSKGEVVSPLNGVLVLAPCHNRGNEADASYRSKHLFLVMDHSRNSEKDCL